MCRFRLYFVHLCKEAALLRVHTCRKDIILLQSAKFCKVLTFYTWTASDFTCIKPGPYAIVSAYFMPKDIIKDFSVAFTELPRCYHSCHFDIYGSFHSVMGHFTVRNPPKQKKKDYLTYVNGTIQVYL